MNVNSIGNAALIAQMQSTNRGQQQVQQSLAMNSLKGAMYAPEQFLQLLEQSVSIKQTQAAAEGLGTILDITA